MDIKGKVPLTKKGEFLWTKRVNSLVDTCVLEKSSFWMNFREYFLVNSRGYFLGIFVDTFFLERLELS